MGTKKTSSHDESASASDGFMLMFVTLSLILLAFFILLNSLAVLDTERRKAALGSLMGSFGLMPGSTGLDKEEGSLGKGSPVNNSSLVQLFKDVEAEVTLLATGTVNGGDVSVTFDRKDGVVRLLLMEKLLFPLGSSEISPMVFPLLDRLAGSVSKNDAYVEVVGHTDNRGKREDNRLLSLRRGSTIARYLEEAAHIDGRIKAGGAAHYHPLKDNNNAAGRFSNRRVEILITQRPEVE